MGVGKDESIARPSTGWSTAAMDFTIAAHHHTQLIWCHRTFNIVAHRIARAIFREDTCGAAIPVPLLDTIKQQSSGPNSKARPRALIVEPSIVALRDQPHQGSVVPPTAIRQSGGYGYNASAGQIESNMAKELRASFTACFEKPIFILPPGDTPPKAIILA